MEVALAVEEPEEWLYDSHCHLAPDVTAADLERYEMPQISAYYHLMSTNHNDVDLVHKLAAHRSVVPYYGIHPWYAHLFTEDLVGSGEIRSETDLKTVHYSKVLKPEASPDLLQKLPVPVNLDQHLAKIERFCRATGGNIGEIGLDKLFRVPTCGFLGNGDGKLSASRVTMEHQMVVFRRQLELAQALARPVSVHCVKAHGVLYDEVQKYHLTVILHSFTGSTDQAKRWIKTYKGVKFLLSNYINGAKKGQLHELLAIIPPDKLLLETDLGIHDYRQERQHLQEIAREVREYYGWDMARMGEVLGANRRELN